MRRAALLAGACIAVVLAGCGLPDDREPRVITADEVPIDLDPSGNNPPSAGGGDEVTVFLFSPDDSRLQAVDRRADDQSVQSAIEALLSDLTASEQADGLQTRIPADVILLDPITVDQEVATINLGCDPEINLPPSACGILGVQSTDQLILFGQFVCTATEVIGVAAVLFQQDGQPQSAQIDGATPEPTTPLRCADYRSLGPDRS